MIKKVLQSVVAVSFVSAINVCCATKTPTVGIVVPLEHPAMNDIVQGFKAELKRQYPHAVNVVVKNAQHDLTMQRMIISQMNGNDTTIIEPIGVDAFEMALANAKKKLVLGIAAEMTDQQRLAIKPVHATSVLDEVNPDLQLAFAKQLLPDLTVITLVHSADDKTLQEVKSVKQVAASLNIHVQDLTVATAPDMMTVSQHLDKRSQAVFVLKDSFIVSQMPALVKQVSARKIPVIASDDGSVELGAAIAIGVKESDIGVAAADMTAAILNGRPIAEFPVKTLTDYRVFVNTDTLSAQGLTLKGVQSVAASYYYPVIMMHNIKGAS